MFALSSVGPFSGSGSTDVTSIAPSRFFSYFGFFFLLRLEGLSLVVFLLTQVALQYSWPAALLKTISGLAFRDNWQSNYFAGAVQINAQLGNNIVDPLAMADTDEK